MYQIKQVKSPPVRTFAPGTGSVGLAIDRRITHCFNIYFNLLLILADLLYLLQLCVYNRGLAQYNKLLQYLAILNYNSNYSAQVQSTYNCISSEFNSMYFAHVLVLLELSTNTCIQTALYQQAS